MLPNNPSVAIVHAEHSLGTVERTTSKIIHFGIGRRDQVCDVDSVSNDRRSRVSAGDTCRPAWLKPTRWEGCRSAVYLPDIITSGSHPVWPIFPEDRCPEESSEAAYRDLQSLIPKSLHDRFSQKKCWNEYSISNVTLQISCHSTLNLGCANQPEFDRMVALPKRLSCVDCLPNIFNRPIHGIMDLLTAR